MNASFTDNGRHGTLATNNRSVNEAKRIRLKAENGLFYALEADHEVSQSHLAKRLKIMELRK